MDEKNQIIIANNLTQLLLRNGEELRTIKNFFIDTVVKQDQRKNNNPLNKYGHQCFSQNDEDGITLEILRRINHLDSGTYIEFGIGDGTENNTLILASLGWNGSWVGGQDLAWDYKPCKKLLFQKDWIVKDKISTYIDNALAHLKTDDIDVVSLDLDGNDIYFAEEILNSPITPKLFIVEYNGVFPPPVKFQIDYDDKHQWNHDSYFGASLSSYVEFFDQYDYRLVCCAPQGGLNAFFVHREFDWAFKDISTDINDLFVQPRYYLYPKGHPKSIKVIENIFRD
jgi:hypothetical protein